MTDEKKGFAAQLSLVQPENDLEWYRSQLSSSGISTDLADYNGLKLHPGHYEMPYFNIDGEYTRISARRNNTQDKDRRYGRKEGKGSGILPTCYWPRHPAMQELSHAELLIRDIRWPLWIVEGEKKALCLQDALVRVGVPGSVVSVPGVTNYAAVLRETKHIYMKGGDLQRPVWIVYDWHHTNPMVLGAEANLHDEMERRGAEVQHLRWRIGPDEGEQKIDDWLVSGGSLLDAITYSMDNEIFLPRADYRWLNEHYAVCNGKIIKLETNTTMGRNEFIVDTAHMQEPGPKGTMVPVAEGWLKWPYRHTVKGRCMKLAQYNELPERVIDGNLNLARRWPEQLLGTHLEASPCEVLDVHLRRFCDDEEQWVWLRQHLAHTLRYPNVTTSNAIAFADDGGTGKGLLMSILRVALGDLFVRIGNELTSNFNGPLVGRLVAHYDEPPSDKWEGGVLDKAAKRLVGNPEIAVRELYKEGYNVDNRIRLLVTTNLQAVYGIPESDRRWNYFCGYEKLSANAAAELAKLRDDPDCPKIVMSWAMSVDLEGYAPMQRGPSSRARRKAVAASRGPVDYWLEESDELANGPDVWVGSRLYDLYRLSTGGRVMSPNVFGAELTRILGDESLKIVTVENKTCRCRAIRNVAQWAKAQGVEWVAELAKSKML